MRKNRRRPRAGFTLLEILIASAILLMTALSVVTLFTFSMSSNTAGYEATVSSNFGRSIMEEFQQVPFDSPRLDANGDDPLVEHFSENEREWLPGETPAAGDRALWLRTTTVNHYHVSALDDGVLDPESEALVAGSHPAWIHLKEIDVVIQSLRRGAAVSSTQDIRYRFIKSQ